MWTIRPEQYDALKQSSVADFRKRAMTYLQTEIPEVLAGLNPDDRNAIVDRATAKANELGFRSELEVILVGHLCLLIGWDFENDTNWEWVTPFLERDEPEPSALLTSAIALASDQIAA